MVAFKGNGSGAFNGVYTGSAGGIPSKITDTPTAIPGGSGNFTGFADVTISGTTVAFYGTGSGGQRGIYFEDNGGALTKLIAKGDTLDGKTVDNVLLGVNGLSATNAAFRVIFSDSSIGVFCADLAPVPEPAFVLGPAAAGLGVARLRHRRRPAG